MIDTVHAFNRWLEATFIGRRGYTVYADGRMERGIARSDQRATVKVESFAQVFGEGAQLDGGIFFVPDQSGTYSGLSGVFQMINGQLTASAEFVWNRAGLRASLMWVWFCLLSAGLDVFSGMIGLMQGTLTGDGALVLAFTLIALLLLMFLPRAIAELKEKLLHRTRQPVIAKLSALVQHEAGEVRL